MDLAAWLWRRGLLTGSVVVMLCRACVRLLSDDGRCERVGRSEGFEIPALGERGFGCFAGLYRGC